jgi:hypothetical protein
MAAECSGLAGVFCRVTWGETFKINLVIAAFPQPWFTGLGYIRWLPDTPSRCTDAAVASMKHVLLCKFITGGYEPIEGALH